MPRVLTVLLVAVALAAAACVSDDPADPASPSVDASAEAAEARLAAVRDARERIGPVAVELGGRALGLAELLRTAVAAPTPAAIDAITGAAEEVDVPLLGVSTLRVDRSVPDVDQAAAALEEAAAAATEIQGAAGDMARVLTRLQEVDERLFLLVATWDEPGSRSQQLERLDATAAVAGQLEAELSETDLGCAGPVEVRAQAAAAVASATRELRELVAGYRGEEFDERLAELGEDPYGFGVPLADAADADADDCELLATVDAAVARVRDALDEVEAALNPADLAA